MPKEKEKRKGRKRTLIWEYLPYERKQPQQHSATTAIRKAATTAAVGYAVWRNPSPSTADKQ
jgi:hypothetical protein